MELSEFIDEVNRAGESQLALNKTMVNDHLDESDRIYLRRNAEAISAAAFQVIAADPTA